MIRLIELTPDTPAEQTQSDGTLAFLAALARTGVSNAVTNLNAKLGAIVTPRMAIPYAVSVDGGGPCYLSSFTRMYMDGAADAFRSSKDVILRYMAPGALASGAVARALGMDDAVTLNNNLHTTSHVADWRGVDVGAMTAALIATYPCHAIWVRGMTDRMHGDELSRLKAQGYLVAPSRPVEIFDPTQPDWRMTRNLKRDIRKLDDIPGLKTLTEIAFSDADLLAMERMCRVTTVDRHTSLLPQYSHAFFRACMQWPACKFLGLRDGGGKLRAFATVMVGPQLITAGTMGYDANDQYARLVYPALSALAMQQAIENQLPYNIGNGAEEFKRLRGAAPAMEMNAVYVRHLPLIKRSLWTATLSAVNRIAGSVIKRL